MNIKLMLTGDLGPVIIAKNAIIVVRGSNREDDSTMVRLSTGGTLFVVETVDEIALLMGDVRCIKSLVETEE